MKINVDIYSGFLGAGKTLLIKKMLNEHAYKKNTIIIENEFGEVGIDGDILRESNIEIKEINAGCICCQVSGNFLDAILEVINKYNPENIIIEPSGVAKLSEILKILKEVKLQKVIEIRNIFTLVDIKNYEIYLKNFNEFYANQIKHAKIIILSRSQLVDDMKIKSTIASIKNINLNAQIIWKPWDILSAKDFFLINNIENKSDLVLINSNINRVLRKEIVHDAKETFESFPIEINKKISIHEIENKFQIIEKNLKFGKVLRAKGFIESEEGTYYQFDYVPNEFNSKLIKWANKKVVSFIGEDLNKREIYKLFK